MARLDTVDLRLLRVFATVVEARGFTAAQTILNVSGSTISNQITALETRLGVTLCQRGRAGFKLTEDGAQIFAEAQKLFSAVDDFDLRSSALRSHIRGNLVVGLVDGTISDERIGLHALFREFTTSMRDVQLAIEMKSPNELLRDLLDGKIHLGIGSFPRIMLGPHYVQLYEETHHLYCAHGNPLFGLAARRVTRELIAGQRLVSRGYWGRRDTKQLGGGRGNATVNSMEAGAHLILSGEYIGYLPEHFARPWIGRGEMKALLPGELSYEAPFELVYDRGVEKLAPARLFIEQVKARFGVEA